MTWYIYSLQVYSLGLCFEVRFGFGLVLGLGLDLKKKFNKSNARFL